MSKRHPISRTLAMLPALVLASALVLWLPRVASAGIYNADTDVAYKEYWIPHSQFTGGHTNPGCVDTNPGGTFYLEPTGNCSKIVTFTISENLARATKAEIYIDLWRNHAPRYSSDGTLTRKASAIFRINNHETWFETHPTGEDWSRTPLVADTVRVTDANGNVDPLSVRPLLSLLQSGQNTITLRRLANSGLYHIHDIAIRIYFDPALPLLDGNGQPIPVPDGQLLTVEADNGVIAAGEGGNLTVNSDRLKLKANVTTAARFVEFHGHYRGYDLDNHDRDGDLGALDRQWHNRGRNDWHPGGRFPQPTGGTVDHIGTVLTSEPGEYEVEWDLAQVMSQAGVRFKIRIVNADNVVREAAGGVSAPFTLQRPDRSLMAVSQTNWQDFVLYHGGTDPETVTRTVFLPCDLVTGNWNSAYVLGSYWQNPALAINGFASRRVFTSGQDSWTLSKREFPVSQFVAGNNSFTYIYPDSSFGQFVEKPGPLVVFKRNSALPADTVAPQISARTPAPGATNVAVNTRVIVTLADNSGGQGIDPDRLRLWINGREVAPQLSCSGASHVLTYTPPGNWPVNSTISVQVEACDLAGNCLSPGAGSHQFSTPLSQHAVTADKVGQGAVQVTPVKGAYNYGETITVAATPANGWTLTGWTVVRSDWGDDTRDFRIPLQLVANGRPRGDRPVQTHINFTALFAALGLPNTLDPNSLRLVQVNSQGQVVAADLPLLFQPAADYHPTTNAAGVLFFHLNNTMAANGVRYYHLYFDAAGKGFSPPPAYNPPAPSGTEGKDPAIWLGGPQAQSVGADPFNPSLNLKVTGALAFTATFEEVIEYALNTSVVGNGSIVREPDRTTYVQNSHVLLTATPDVGWRFAGWSGSATGAEPVLNLLMDGYKALVATFEKVYTLAVNQVGQGQVTVVPQQAVYREGEQVTLTATAANGWRFTGWTGAVVSPSTPLTLTLDSDQTVTANFQAIRTLTLSQQGQGQLVVDPVQDLYLHGDMVTLTATPAAGWVFAGWSGDQTGADAAITLTMDSDKSLVARFLKLHSLQIDHTGGGEVVRNPDEPAYVDGNTVLLTATPAPGWVFAGWEGDLGGAANPASLLMNDDKRVTARFAQLYALTVTVDGTGGAVQVTPQEPLYLPGTVVTLTAATQPGWSFAGWSGDFNGADPIVAVTMSSNQTIIATFVRNEYTLTIRTPTGGGAVKREPARETYFYNEEVTVTAEAESGWTFTGWGGALSGDANPHTLVITGNLALEATFSQTPFTIHTSVVGSGSIVLAPTQSFYHPGTQVMAVALPGPGWAFSGWSGDLSGTNTHTLLTVDSNKSITATFTPLALTVSVATVGNGAVMVDPVKATYQPGERVTLTATPVTGWLFIGWGGDLRGANNPRTLTLDASLQVTAAFGATAAGIIVAGENGTVTLSPEQEFYQVGDEVTLEALPDPGWEFVAWQVTGEVGAAAQDISDNPLTIVIDGRTTYQPLFRQMAAGGSNVIYLPVISQP